MMRKFKHGINLLKWHANERLFDMFNIVWPIFLVSGILVACFKFWLWLFA